MRNYTRSEEYLARAEKTIPLGTQTFGKCRTQFPYGASPYFITHGRGSHVWDVDGNEYIDLFNGGTTMTLGYNDEDVTSAVEKQLKNGVIFSLPHPLEMQVSEMIVEMVPCAEMVRFGKNGSDVTSAAIRLARAFTDRDHIAVCGYHGWQDWYIGSTSRHRGVPQATRDLTHTFQYNNCDSLRELFSVYPGRIAAVILEPLSWVKAPDPGYLESVKEITNENGALLIFDEMVSGFRVAKGGAQECFGVTPDLATFGKGLANGFPLSAVAGSAKVMKLMEDIFYSLTHAGETLSLAASLATLNKLKTQPVLSTLSRTGQHLKSGVQERLERHGAGTILEICGHPAFTVLQFKDVCGYTQWQIRTLFMQEMLARGILTLGMQIISYSHQPEDIAAILAAYDEVLPIMKEAVDTRSLERRLRCKPIEPLFKVRQV